MEQIICAVGEAQRYTAGPSVIIAKTVKGKGVSFMENNPAFHGSPPNKEQYDKALIELN
jgi:transketolase